MIHWKMQGQLWKIDDYTVVDALIFLGEMALFCLVCFAVFCFPVIIRLAPREVL